MSHVLAQPRGRVAAALTAIAVAIAATAGLVFGIASVSADSSKVHDPKGDVASGVRTLDIVKASVDKQGDVFRFTLKVDEVIPDPFPEGEQWNFVMDTDPDVCQEWLFCDPDDYLVGLQPNPATGEHEGVLIHLTNPPPFDIVSIPYEINGKQIRLFVDEDLLGDPATLSWYANARPAPFPAPTADEAPDGADNGVVVWEANN